MSLLNHRIKFLNFIKDKMKDDQKWPGVRTKSIHSLNPKLFSFVVRNSKKRYE